MVEPRLRYQGLSALPLIKLPEFFFPLIKFSKYQRLTKGSSKRMFSLSYSLLALSYLCDLFIIINGILFFSWTWIEPNLIASLIFAQKGMLKSVNIHFFFLCGKPEMNVPIYPGQQNHIEWFPKI